MERSQEFRHFRLDSSQQIHTTEHLNEYIRVATPATWMLLVALFLMVVSLSVWGFTGTVPRHLTLPGVGISNRYDPTKGVSGNPEDYPVQNLICLADATQGTSRQIDRKPCSVIFRDGRRVTGTAYLLDTALLKDQEIRELLDYYSINSDWVFAQLGSGSYRYTVNVYLDEPLDYLYWGESAQVSIITDEVPPIRFLFQ